MVARSCRPVSKLETLYLNSNRLEGTIPDTIGNLTKLRELIIYDNQLAGRIPTSISAAAAHQEQVRHSGGPLLQLEARGVEALGA
ncbi:hypothetical protein E2562_035668 [Oryza meyeriana var. granulata]|uniref:Leucine-rich repeat-containing N-terminal plant-type domain-containing protein n=1 Tax=Oryza meyeriana var. granulata TaxID=110450 RepID=A0A6G1E713_9ORYZ|nr:hypothetical protein E2562_035668 [Oryza meyeriana var. granulata]